MLVVEVLWVKAVAVLALDSQCIVDHLLELFQSVDCLLKVYLLSLHLDDLLTQVLVSHQQLFVLFFHFRL